MCKQSKILGWRRWGTKKIGKKFVNRKRRILDKKVIKNELEDTMSLIKIKLNDEIVTVDRVDYVKAKTKDLIEFGYTDLKEESVDKEVQKILDGNENLSVIGKFIEDDIIVGE